MWGASQRLQRYMDAGQTPIILHFGDHDPSGIDMTRDIIDRMRLFIGHVKIDRLALNMDQVEEHQPPPNPAKLSDSRCEKYIEVYGDESWELDALDPTTLAGLVNTAIEGLIDKREWAKAVAIEEEHRRKLAVVAGQWDKLTRRL